MTEFRLRSLSAPRRLAVGLFLALLLGFYALSQLQLVAAVGNGSSYPTAHDVLVKYHGDTARSRFHKVLDPMRSESDAKNMYKHLSADVAERPALRAKILDWVEAGMPRGGWSSVSGVLASSDSCAGCHRAGAGRADLPFETYEEVVAAAGVDTGISTLELSTSSHNHLMGFAVVALLASLAFSATRWTGPIVSLLVAGASVGAVLDIASWWLTKSHGSPWQYGVLVGGGLFGACTMTMVVLSLDELWFGGRLGGLVEVLVRSLGLGRRDPA